jgi:type II secretory pathway component PulF
MSETAAVILGAFIGAVAPILVIVIQLKYQRKFDIDSRLFSARKEVYEKVLADISHGHSERVNNRKWPPSSLHPDNRKVNDVLASASLYSSKELLAEMAKLFQYLGSDVPSDQQIKIQEDEIRNELWRNIIRQMRKELGTGEFLKESIPNPPQD